METGPTVPLAAQSVGVLESAAAWAATAPLPVTPPPALPVTLPPAMPVQPYPVAAPTTPYGAPLQAPTNVPVARSSTVPLLVGAGVLVALAVAGAVLWTTGVLPGWLNVGSKTAISTVQPSVTPSTTVENPETDSTSGTLPPDGPVVTALSDADSLDAIDSGYTTVTRFEDQFAAKPTGWIWSVWSKKIDTRNDPAALSSLADEARSWVDDMTTKREDFAALAVSSTYQSYQQELLGIFELMIERANIYYKTTVYAVDHPTKADGTQPWRAMQNGSVDSGKSSAQAAADVKAALAAFVLP